MYTSKNAVTRITIKHLEDDTMTEKRPLTQQQLDVLLNQPDTTCIGVGLTLRYCDKCIEFENACIGIGRRVKHNSEMVCISVRSYGHQNLKSQGFSINA